MIGTVFDRLLGRLVSRSFRRGLAGEPVFLVLGAAAWLVVRSRSKDRPVVWSGTLKEGERLVLTSLGPENSGRENSGQENLRREESGTSQPG
jgi:hypothetical protein